MIFEWWKEKEDAEKRIRGKFEANSDHYSQPNGRDGPFWRHFIVARKCASDYSRLEMLGFYNQNHRIKKLLVLSLVQRAVGELLD